MKLKTNGRILRVAIAGSLCVHLLIALIVHAKPVTAAPEQKPEHGDIIVLHLPKPTPTPQPPKPRPPQKTANAVAHRPAVHVPHIAKNTNGPVTPYAVASELPGTPEPYAEPTPDVAGTAAPLPTASPTPRPACSAPDVDARAVDVVQPQTPPDVAAVNAQAKVKVDLDANGNVTHASIYAPTGYPQLDRAAIDAARQSRYEAEKRDCKSVPGSYLFTVQFNE